MYGHQPPDPYTGHRPLHQNIPPEPIATSHVPTSVLMAEQRMHQQQNRQMMKQQARPMLDWSPTSEHAAGHMSSRHPDSIVDGGIDRLRRGVVMQEPVHGQQMYPEEYEEYEMDDGSFTSKLKRSPAMILTGERAGERAPPG
jgi:hypothetical protein